MSISRWNLYFFPTQTIYVLSLLPLVKLKPIESTFSEANFPFQGILLSNLQCFMDKMPLFDFFLILRYSR